MTNELPKGVREDELTSFTTEHPQGVRVRFVAGEANSWVISHIEAPDHFGNPTIERCVDTLINDVERHGDALVLNGGEIVKYRD